MKKRFISVILLAGTMIVASSCKEEKKSQDIITHKVEKKKAPATVQNMSDYSFDKSIEWLGSSYTIALRRFSDKELPMAVDESGHKYYDNKISLKVVRADGSLFFERVFTKGDFKDYANKSYYENGALLGLVFDRAEGGSLYFAASVGSPDTMSDEYIPLVVVISKTGDLKILKDTQMDTGNGDAQPKSELEMAEEEGI